MKILLLLLFPLTIFAQSNNIILRINKVTISNYTYIVNTSLVNNSERIITIYKANVKDIRYSILKFFAKDSVGNKYEFYPFETSVDLESIYLDCNNSIQLCPQEGFIKTYKLDIKKFTPYIKKGKYKLYIELNYSISNFRTELKNVLIDDLISNGYSFIYPALPQISQVCDL